MIEFLEFTNETVTIAVVIISISMLLYNITRNGHDRVTRASSILLACVTLAYVADVFVGLDPNPLSLERWFRVQWIGVALVPTALFHLSDALLATTGKVSRGRRRKAVRVSYTIGILLALTGALTDEFIRDLQAEPVWHMQPGPLFGVYLAYFVVAVGVSLTTVYRAWKRCLTTYTRRRMTYLLAVFLTPAWGIFPYSLLFAVLSSGLSTFSEFWLWMTFNIANFAVLAMLAFMAYPLSFFGARKPDRLVRAELLQFMLRGPVTGVAVVGVIQSFPHVSPVLGIEGQEFMTFAAVTAVLCMQWSITLIWPWLESRLIYTQDQQQARLFQEISKRLLTRADIEQLLEAILAAVCDQLRVPTSFIASIGPGGTRLEKSVGHISEEDQHILEEDLLITSDDSSLAASLRREGEFFVWQSFWLIPLRTTHTDGHLEISFLGLLGVWRRDPLDEDEKHILDVLLARAADVLADMRLQAQIFSTIEGMLPEPITRSHLASISAFGQVSLNGDSRQDLLRLRESIVSSPDFTDMVRNALRDYWGGPNLVDSELLNLAVVDEAAAEDGNKVNGLRRVLVEAIERLRPEGQQNFTRTDWILYNILEMRFLQGRKVRDVALRLAMSQADFYRKQRAAIEEVARIIAELEQEQLEQFDAGKPDAHAVLN